MTTDTIYSASGCRLEELNFDAIQKGEINAEDFRIGSKRLLYQADVAKEASYSRLAVNLTSRLSWSRFQIRKCSISTTLSDREGARTKNYSPLLNNWNANGTPA